MTNKMPLDKNKSLVMNSNVSIGIPLKDLTPEQQRRVREACAKGGRNGSTEDKRKAGLASWQARLKKAQEALKISQQHEPQQ